ncbi:MAG: glycosyltransferase family 8 protein [Erysipelotrichaceae bacterium]|jgi:lipopolysaccharide biosynthesis glycosyltransferase|nr:glycosyltransferase family 8 protein [Erysipelotrichaceae bacterium]
MKIFYSSNNSYAPILGISLTSFFKHNQGTHEIYILDVDISNENKDKLIALTKTNQGSIFFVKLPRTLHNIYDDFDNKRWSIATFGRLFAASLFPDVDKLLYLDCDIIINKDLSSLYNTDIQNVAVAGVKECLSNNYNDLVHIPPTSFYLQAGVLLMNLAYMRKHDLEARFIKYSKTHPKVLYNDQDILNACLKTEEKIRLPLKYNVYTPIRFFNYQEILKARRLGHFYVSESEYQTAKADPYITHFTYCFLDGKRPWIKGSNDPSLAEYQAIKQDSLWTDMKPLLDQRSKKKRFLHGIMKHLPKFIMLPLLGYLHGKLIPHRAKKNYQD